MCRFLTVVSMLVRLRVFSFRNLVLSYLPNTNFSAVGQDLANISLSNPAVPVTSPNNLLAYRPNYADTHGSNLGAIFLNLLSIFPCSNAVTINPMICSLANREEDGFNQGQVIIGTQDIQFNVFGTDVLSYDIAIESCPQLDSSCLPDSYTFTVTCQIAFHSGTRWQPDVFPDST